MFEPKPGVLAPVVLAALALPMARVSSRTTIPA